MINFAVFVALYRCPSQIQDDFFDIFTELWINLRNFFSVNNPYLLVAIGDFNKKLRHDTITFEVISVGNVASRFGFHQIIKEPQHVLESSSSCIDLAFTSQPNLIVD